MNKTPSIPRDMAEGARPSGSLIAAYEVGKLCNQLLWYLQQAFLLGSEKPASLVRARRQQGKAVDKAISALKAKAYVLYVGDSSAIRDGIFKAQRLWDQVTSPPDEYYFPTLNEANERYLRSSGDEHARETICQGLINADVKPLVDDLRKSIRALFKDPADRQAFDLGNLFDQGLRRPDVFRFMYDFDAPPLHTARRNSGDAISDDGELTLTDWEEGGNSSMTEDLLIECRRKSGDLAPDPAWFSELKSLLLCVLPKEELPFVIKSRPKTVRRSSRAEFIVAQRAMDKTIRKALNLVESRNALLGWDEATKERNKYCYDQMMLGTLYKNITSEVKRRGWKPLSSIPAIKRAGNAYADKAGLTRPPARRSGRPKGKM